MIIKSLTISSGLFEKKRFDISPKLLIYSRRNSVGKTTLLRAILYALGFNVPSTKGIRFEKCEFKLEIQNELKQDVVLERVNSSIRVHIDKKLITYALPGEILEVHKLIFNCKNIDVLINILGCFYIDQEKGWTLLNRGTPIGSNEFNIEAFIRGLADVDCFELNNRKKKIERQLEKYKQMRNVSAYQQAMAVEVHNNLNVTYDEKQELILFQLKMRCEQLKRERHQYDLVVAENERIRQYVEKLKLRVRIDDKEIPIVAENIVDLQDFTQLAKTRQNKINLELNAVLKEMDKLFYEKKKNDEQQEFFTSETMLDAFSRSVSAININAKMVEREIKRHQNEIHNINNQISVLTKGNEEIINNMYELVKKYMMMLGIETKDLPGKDYLFTSDLQSMSGAYLHLRVFAFKMAYVKMVENCLKINLPILVDSPYGKEVEEDNVQKIIQILEKEFSNHQVIIVSIHNQYSISGLKQIEIKQCLLE